MTTFVLPGDRISAASSSHCKVVGYGIENKCDDFIASRPGLLMGQNDKVWISVHSRRYIPEKGDRVIGVISGKQGDVFKVDIGSADIGFISFLAFEGATKRNRPDLKTGDVIYAQVQTSSKHLEPELTCVDSVARAKGLGQLKGGLLFKAPLHLARRIISQSSSILKILGKDYKFEITVGLNGKIWLNSSNPKEVMDIRSIILSSEFVLESDIAEFAEQQIRIAKGFCDTPMEQS